MDADKLKRIALLKNTIQQATDEIKVLQGELGLSNMDPGMYVEGNVYAKITPNTRWSKEKALAFAKENYPLEEDGTNAELYEVTIEVKQAVAKKKFSAEDYAACVNTFDNKVEVGLV
jgi:hypothetical protein